MKHISCFADDLSFPTCSVVFVWRNFLSNSRLDNDSIRRSTTLGGLPLFRRRNSRMALVELCSFRFSTALRTFSTIQNGLPAPTGRMPLLLSTVSLSESMTLAIDSIRATTTLHMSFVWLVGGAEPSTRRYIIIFFGRKLFFTCLLLQLTNTSIVHSNRSTLASMSYPRVQNWILLVAVGSCLLFAYLSKSVVQSVVAFPRRRLAFQTW